MSAACARLEALLAGLLPSGVAVAAGAADDRLPLADSEAVAARSMAPGRRAEFAAGRACARRALAAIGFTTAELPVGPDRAPVWPTGCTGSITHADGMALVAVGRNFAGLGIDLEPAAALPPDILERVCSRTERDSSPHAMDPRIWARAVFSAKESAYKALAARVGRFIDFGELTVMPLAPGVLCFAPASGVADLAAARRLTAAYAVVADWIVTTAWERTESP